MTPSPKRATFILRSHIARTGGKMPDTSFAFSNFKPDIPEGCIRTKSTPKVRRAAIRLSPKREPSDLHSVPRLRHASRSRVSPSRTQCEPPKLPDSHLRSPKNALLVASPRQQKQIFPISGKNAAKIYAKDLTDYEKLEVVGVKEVYFVGKTEEKYRGSDGSFDDERGDYVLVPGDHLNYRYEVLALIGKGSFGQVSKCVDHKSKTTVAVKLIRNKKRLYTQGLIEIQALQTLCVHDSSDSHCIVRLWGSFSFRGHLCLVFELLYYNLYELLKSRSYSGLPLPLCRRICAQMLLALEFMRKNEVIHCDLKPENVMLAKLNSAEIKVIDFGSCCFAGSQIYTYIQSRFYRAPEVVFGIRYTTQIDMWSLGCIAAELFTGAPIFPGESEQDLILLVIELIGVPNKELIDAGGRSHLFFADDGQPKFTEDGKGVRREPHSKRLSAVLSGASEAFVDFVGRCLVWEPNRRLTPSQGLQHSCYP